MKYICLIKRLQSIKIKENETYLQFDLNCIVNDVEEI